MRERAERFELLGEVGRGTGGRVYLALDRRAGRRVALKSAGEDPRVCLEHELKMASAVRHPNVVEVFGIFEHDLTPRLAMEFVEGRTLRWYAFDPGRVVAELGVQACAGLQALHEGGIAHRDIKPGNIMVSEDKGTRRLVLVDFGLASSATEGPWTSAGTIEYLAPEILTLGSSCTFADLVAADLYALATSLYEILSGDLPFCGDAKTLLRQKLEEDAYPIRQVRTRVSEGLDDVVLRALSRDPAARFASAADFGAALAACIDGEDDR